MHVFWAAAQHSSTLVHISAFAAHVRPLHRTALTVRQCVRGGDTGVGEGSAARLLSWKLWIVERCAASRVSSPRTEFLKMPSSRSSSSQRPRDSSHCTCRSPRNISLICTRNTSGAKIYFCSNLADCDPGHRTCSGACASGTCSAAACVP